jgi:hypothetical protein
MDPVLLKQKKDTSFRITFFVRFNLSYFASRQNETFSLQKTKNRLILHHIFGSLQNSFFHIIWLHIVSKQKKCFRFKRIKLLSLTSQFPK